MVEGSKPRRNNESAALSPPRWCLWWYRKVGGVGVPLIYRSGSFSGPWRGRRCGGQAREFCPLVSPSRRCGLRRQWGTREVWPHLVGVGMYRSSLKLAVSGSGVVLLKTAIDLALGRRSSVLVLSREELAGKRGVRKLASGFGCLPRLHRRLVSNLGSEGCGVAAPPNVRSAARVPLLATGYESGPQSRCCDGAFSEHRWLVLRRSPLWPVSRLRRFRVRLCWFVQGCGRASMLFSFLRVIFCKVSL